MKMFEKEQIKIYKTVFFIFISFKLCIYFNMFQLKHIYLSIRICGVLRIVMLPAANRSENNQFGDSWGSNISFPSEVETYLLTEVFKK